MSLQKIKRVTIVKLWDNINISVDFHDNVNIFIGKNGTYKTTFLKLVEAVLRCDVKILCEIVFEQIMIQFSSDEVGDIKVFKYNTQDRLLEYTFNDGKYIISGMDVRESYPHLSFHVYGDNVKAIKKKLAEIVMISWLSINRSSFEIINLDKYSFNRDFDAVNKKLRDLIQKLRLYQLPLEAKANLQADKFKQEALSLMLYDEKFDNLNLDSINEFSSANIESLQNDLVDAFTTLGLASGKIDNIKERIMIHIKKIKYVSEKLAKKEEIAFNELFILPLTARTLSIINTFKEHKKETDAIFESIEKFKKCIKDFILNKEFILDNEKGNIDIKLEGKGNETLINISSLSSGEKQIFILLAEALLQEEKPYLFIADEPELSLHIDWQRKILNALLDLNPNAQIIVATHSPEIAGSFPDNITNMIKIISYD